MGIAEILHTLFLVTTSLVGWAVKSTLEKQLKPIHEEMTKLRQSVEAVAKSMESHSADVHPHPNFEKILDEKYVQKKPRKGQKKGS